MHIVEVLGPGHRGEDRTHHAGLFVRVDYIVFFTHEAKDGPRKKENVETHFCERGANWDCLNEADSRRPINPEVWKRNIGTHMVCNHIHTMTESRKRLQSPPNAIWRASRGKEWLRNEH